MTKNGLISTDLNSSVFADASEKLISQELSEKELEEAMLCPKCP
jgi:hypothetical protein